MYYFVLLYFAKNILQKKIKTAQEQQLKEQRLKEEQEINNTLLISINNTIISLNMCEIIFSKYYHSFQSLDKFFKYFIPENIIINNAKIYHIYDKYINDEKINILISVENCSYHNFKEYRHFYKYGNYGNNKIQIYFYNHIDKCSVTDTYISIPVIYTRINYFNIFYPEIKPSISIPFKQKKFCLIAYNKNFTDKYKNEAIKTLRNIGICDDLEIHKPILKNKSCYHSIEFLNILQEYKFIFVCENSVGDGYITEKIFNCFFSRCIPIYIGCKNIEYYFNNNCFINANDLKNLNKIDEIQHNEVLFNEIINTNKINTGYDDENYKLKLKTFLASLNKYEYVSSLDESAV